MLGIYDKGEGARSVWVSVDLPEPLHRKLIDEKYARHPRATIAELVVEIVGEWAERRAGKEGDMSL